MSPLGQKTDPMETDPGNLPIPQIDFTFSAAFRHERCLGHITLHSHVTQGLDNGDCLFAGLWLSLKRYFESLSQSQRSGEEGCNQTQDEFHR